MNGTYRVVVEDRGRVALPTELRERSGLVTGTVLTLFETPAGLVLMSREQLLQRVRVDLSGLDLVGELLDGRRAEAEREDFASD